MESLVVEAFSVTTYPMPLITRMSPLFSVSVPVLLNTIVPVPSEFAFGVRFPLALEVCLHTACDI